MPPDDDARRAMPSVHGWSSMICRVLVLVLLGFMQDFAVPWRRYSIHPALSILTISEEPLTTECLRSPFDFIGLLYDVVEYWDRPIVPWRCLAINRSNSDHLFANLELFRELIL